MSDVMIAENVGDAATSTPEQTPYYAPREPLPWEQVATFESHGFTVIVSKQASWGQVRPRFSMEVGRRVKDDPARILHHLGILVDDSRLYPDSDSVEFLNDPINLANLIEDAGSYIRDQLMRSRREWLEDQQENFNPQS